MRSEYSYGQFNKNFIRHNVLSYAIELLTSKREESACVHRSYVRKLYDFFTLNEDESSDKKQALKIDLEHIKSWENLHDANIGIKKPQDLTICYLCGPEPQNDFKELISLGVLPQNIWAFEIDRATYQKAIDSFGKNQIPQPHILKQKIETFFSNTPKKFDIIYVDACGSVPSEQHALRCITHACFYHRLESPGVIISNFAKPDNKEAYLPVIRDYLFSKSLAGGNCTFDNWESEKEKFFLNSDNFEKEYGDFISYLLRDIPGIIVPLQRLWKNQYIEQILDKSVVEKCNVTKEFFDSINYHSCGKNFLLNEISNCSDEMKKQLKKELNNYPEFINALKMVLLLRLKSESILKDDIKTIYSAFEKAKPYQFLDKHHSHLLFDVINNQLAYPMHCNTKMCKRYRYTAKSVEMFTDVTVYDECRYIYDWLPSIHQLKSIYSNESWQYIFRFALDGLVKSRKNYNNEFFFQGSVVSDKEEGFGTHKLQDRILL